MMETLTDMPTLDGRKYRADKELFRLRQVIIWRSYRTYTNQYSVFLSVVGRLGLDPIDFFWQRSPAASRDLVADLTDPSHQPGWTADDRNRRHFTMADGSDAHISLGMVPFWCALTDFLIEIMRWDMFERQVLRPLNDSPALADCRDLANWLNGQMDAWLKSHLPTETQNRRFRVALDLLGGRATGDAALPSADNITDPAILDAWSRAATQGRGDWRTFRSARQTFEQLSIILDRGKSRAPQHVGEHRRRAAEAMPHDDSNDDDTFDSDGPASLSARLAQLADRKGNCCILDAPDAAVLSDLLRAWPWPRRLCLTSLRDHAFRPAQGALGRQEALDAAMDQATGYHTLVDVWVALHEKLRERSLAVLDAALSGSLAEDETARDAAVALATTLDPNLIAADLEQVRELLRDDATADTVVSLERFAAQASPMFDQRLGEIAGKMTGPGNDLYKLSRTARRTVRRSGITAIRKGEVQADDLADVIDLLITCLTRLSQILKAMRGPGESEQFDDDRLVFTDVFRGLYGENADARIRI